MLYLLFRLGEDRYALDTASIKEVLPVVNWKEIPQSENGILGIFNYHGETVPLLDLAEFIIGKRSRLCMSTRIILVNYRDIDEHRGTDEVFSPDGRLLGLLAESATFTFESDPDQFSDPGVDVETAPYLGPVATGADGIIQLIEVQRLLPTSVKNQLFHEIRDDEQESGTL